MQYILIRVNKIGELRYYSTIVVYNWIFGWHWDLSFFRRTHVNISILTIKRNHVSTQAKDEVSKLQHSYDVNVLMLQMKWLKIWSVFIWWFEIFNKYMLAVSGNLLKQLSTFWCLRVCVCCMVFAFIYFGDVANVRQLGTEWQYVHVVCIQEIDDRIEFEIECHHLTVHAYKTADAVMESTIAIQQKAIYNMQF